MVSGLIKPYQIGYGKKKQSESPLNENDVKITFLIKKNQQNYKPN